MLRGTVFSLYVLLEYLNIKQDIVYQLWPYTYILKCSACTGLAKHNKLSKLLCIISRLMVVSHRAKKKQAVRDERVSYLQVAPLGTLLML